MLNSLSHFVLCSSYSYVILSPRLQSFSSPEYPEYYPNVFFSSFEPVILLLFSSYFRVLLLSFERVLFIFCLSLLSLLLSLFHLDVRLTHFFHCSLYPHVLLSSLKILFFPSPITLMSSCFVLSTCFSLLLLSSCALFSIQLVFISSPPVNAVFFCHPLNWFSSLLFLYYSSVILMPFRHLFNLSFLVISFFFFFFVLPSSYPV